VEKLIGPAYTCAPNEFSSLALMQGRGFAARELVDDHNESLQELASKLGPALHAAIAELPIPQQIAVRGTFFKQQTPTELAERLGADSRFVRRLLHEAIVRLRRSLAPILTKTQSEDSMAHSSSVAQSGNPPSTGVPCAYPGCPNPAARS